MCQQAFAWPHNFQRTALGKCRMCRGWRSDVPDFLTLREILSAELPGALRPNMVFKKDTLKLVPMFGALDENGDPTLNTKIHRDDAEQVVGAIRMCLRRLLSTTAKTSRIQSRVEEIL